MGTVYVYVRMKRAVHFPPQFMTHEMAGVDSDVTDILPIVLQAQSTDWRRLVVTKVRC